MTVGGGELFAVGQRQVNERLLLETGEDVGDLLVGEALILFRVAAFVLPLRNRQHLIAHLQLADGGERGPGLLGILRAGALRSGVHHGIRREAVDGAGQPAPGLLAPLEFPMGYIQVTIGSCSEITCTTSSRKITLKCRKLELGIKVETCKTESRGSLVCENDFKYP